jgi:hypothetical protein
MARTETPRAAIEKTWGFAFPEDLFDVWEVARTALPKRPCSAFRDTMGVTLEGPFVVLAGGKPDRTLDRWTSDPPEFFSVAAGDSDGLHWGYVAHEPGKTEPRCAHFYSREGYPISYDKTLFAALRDRLEEVRDEIAEQLLETVDLGEPDRDLAKSLAAADAQLEKFAARRVQTKRSRTPKSIAPTLDGLGIVCPARLYAKPLVADARLLTELRDPKKRVRHVAYARALLAKRKPGGALKIARELYAILPEKDAPPAIALLSEVYAALERPVLARAIERLAPEPAKGRTAAKAPGRDTHFTSLGEAAQDLASVTSLAITYHSADKTVPSKAQFSQMKKLERLILRGLTLADLPIAGLPIRTLELFECRVPRFPSAIAKLSKLEELSLTKLRAPIPEELPSSGWMRLTLAHQDIKTVPKFVLRAKRLYHLTLYYNRIEEIPEALGELCELRYLNLQNNKLPELPDIFEGLTKLQSLWLENNRLQTLPDSIASLRKTLKSLSLGKNPLAKDAAERARIKKLLPKTKIYWT